MNDAYPGDGPQGLYVHIPFCVHKCPYCDFASGPVSKAQRQVYLQSLDREIRFSSWVGSPVRTLFLGGGTPSELQVPELTALMTSLGDSFDLSGLQEVTMECNPGTLRPRQLEQVRALGVNRISLGVQSFNDNYLEILERVHSSQDSVSAYEAMRSAGFDNVSFDLMFGLPGQTLEQWQDDLRTAIALAPDHLSLYQLTIEKGTPFGLALEAGALVEFDSELGADMYEWTIEATSHAGLLQYEISNFCRPGYECHHNRLYWENQYFLGLGLGAASYMNGRRWTNTRDLNSYSQHTGCPDRESDERLPLRSAMSEELILGLRLNEGISLRRLEERFGLDPLQLFAEPIEFLLTSGHVTFEGDNLLLTRRGRLVASSVSAEFLAACPSV